MISQVWKLGLAKFETYGVYVAKSSGLFDVPEIEDEGYDWLDENGKSYWVDFADLNISDRQIVLNCWITASSYANLTTNIGLFFTAITGKAPLTLTTPYGDITNVILLDEVPVIRETNYVATQQAGTFSLRLTVLGTTNTKQLSIYRNGVFYNYLNYDDSMRVNCRLMGENYMTITVEQYSPSTFSRNDYCLLDITGNKEEVYYLDKEPEIQKKSSNKFIINYRFEHESFKLKNVMFLNDDSDADFYWYADLEEVVDQIVSNVARYSGITVYKGTPFGVTTIKKNHKFSNESCYDVLLRLCTEYECEFQFDYVAGSWRINVDDIIENSWPFTLQYGKGNGLYEITREALNTEELCTSLWAYGATKNLRWDYGHSRLVCPGNPLSSNEATYGKIEKVKYFDDVYPAFSGMVTSYERKLPTDTSPAMTVQELNTWPAGYYRIGATVDFDIEANSLGQIRPKVVMTSGNCKGLDFEVLKHDTDNNYIFISPFVDEHAGTWPSDSVYPEADDTFTLIDTKQDSSYETLALAQLEIDALAWLADHDTPKVTYRVVVDPSYIHAVFESDPDHDGFRVGDSVHLEDSDLVIDDDFRITELTKNYYTGVYDLTLSHGRTLTKREIITMKIDKIERNQSDTDDDEVEVMRKDQVSTGELHSRLFVASDNKLNVDDIVRSESIDPRMLAYDSGVPQFFITGLMIELNYNNDVDTIKINSGTISITNYAPYTEDRYTIDKIISNTEEYNPVRTWDILDNIYSLSAGITNYVYVKIPLDEGVSLAEIVILDEHVEVKRYINDNDLYYKLGYITEAQSPRQAGMLWGNVKTTQDIEDIAQQLTGKSVFGCLYNDYAIQDVRGIASEGWHVPTESEYNSLVEYVNGWTLHPENPDLSGQILKSKDEDYWQNYGSNTDGYWFNGRGGGQRDTAGLYAGLKYSCYLGTNGNAFKLSYDANDSTFETLDSKCGRSLRLVADSTELSGDFKNGWYHGNDGKIYRTICINGVEWMSEDLAESFFANGDEIPNITDATEWSLLTDGARCDYDNNPENSNTKGEISDYIEKTSEVVASDLIEVAVGATDYEYTEENYIANEDTVKESIDKLDIEIKNISDISIGGMDITVEVSGSMPSVDNTNNVLKVRLLDTNTNELYSVLIGSNSAYKAWHGDDGDLPETRSSDTIYYVNEE